MTMENKRDYCADFVYFPCAFFGCEDGCLAPSLSSTDSDGAASAKSNKIKALNYNRLSFSFVYFAVFKSEEDTIFS